MYNRVARYVLVIRKMHCQHYQSYLIQFGNIVPSNIERINDYREDMKLSGLAGRVNCHYANLAPPLEEGDVTRSSLLALAPSGNRNNY